MTQRERLLAGCVGGALLLLGGYQVVRTRVVAPMTQLRRDVESARALRARLAAELRESHDKTRKGWQELTGRTVGESPFDAHLAFYNDVAKLVEQSGLHEPSLKRPQPTTYNKGFKSGFVELPVSISAQGTLEQVITFLRDFYRRPYLARVRQITFTVAPDSSRGGRARANRPGRAARSGREPAAENAPAPAVDIPFRLNARFEVVALVLPAMQGLPHGALTAEELTTIESSALRSEPEIYDEIAQLNMFRKFQAPPPIAPPVEPTQVADSAPRETPRIDTRAGADKKVLIGTTSYRGQAVAYVRDERKETEPPEQFRLKDRIDDGELVLVHPTGIVVHVDGTGQSPRGRRGRTPTSDEAEPGVSAEYFYALGKSFKDRVPLDPAIHAELWRELQLVRTE